MLPFSRAFVYAGIAALHAAVDVGGKIYIHRTPFPGMRNPSMINPGLEKLMSAIKRRGSIDTMHWELLGSTAWRP